MGRPYLSIVTTGRNDGYGGDFNSRFLRTLAFNARHLEDRGVSAEFVFVEWAPPKNVPLLLDLAFEALPALDRLHGIVVDAAYQDALSMNPRIAYLEFIAKNVGIRRARGEFVLSTNADVYLSREILDVLARRELQPRIVYRARRIDLKLGMDVTRLDWTVLEDERNYDTGLKPLRPPLYSGGTGDFVLLDASTFNDLRGFNEVYRLAKIGIDRNILVKALHSGVNITDVGGPVYHLNHAGSYRMTKNQYRNRQADAPYGNRSWPSGSIVYRNGEDWGLGRAPSAAVSATVTELNFDWAAVPPLIELSGILNTGLAEQDDRLENEDATSLRSTV